MAAQGKADNVTALSWYRKVDRNPILKELHDHWEALRADRIAPRRSEIDPRRIENVLEHAFILECTADGEARFRIAGIALGDLMGMEVRGMPATALVQPQDRARFSALLRDLCRNAEIADLTLATASGARAEMLLLPMTGEDGRVSRILGCMVARPGAAPPPVRLTLVEIRRTRIVAQADDRVHATEGFAEPVPTWQSAAPMRRSGRPDLRLLKGGVED
jgi:hypothetical protein